MYFVSATEDRFTEAWLPIQEVLEGERPSGTAIAVQALWTPELQIEVEMTLRSSLFPAGHEEGGVAGSVAALLLDELSAPPDGNLHLPMPSDRACVLCSKHLLPARLNVERLSLSKIGRHE